MSRSSTRRTAFVLRLTVALCTLAACPPSARCQAPEPAVTETGLVVNVPLFVNTGDVIRVDTRDGSYIERV